MTAIRRIAKRLLFGTPRPAARDIRSILVIRRNGIGDMICAFPLIRGLKQAHPQARLTVLADPANAPVARCCEAIDEVLVFPLGAPLFTGRTWQAWRTARCLRRLHFDLAVGASGSFSRLLAQMVYGSGAGIRAGTLPAERVAEPFYYSHYRVRYNASRTHQILTGAEILAAMGLECDPDAIQLNIPADETDRAKAWLKARLDPARPLVWLHLSNRRPESRWSPANFKELVLRLTDQTGACVVLARAPNDRDFDRSYFDSVQNSRVVWFENESFLQFAATLAQARVVVCGDGGVMHLGAAVGSTVVALFSATEPEIWKPWGKSHVVLKRGDSVDLIPVADVLPAVVSCL